MINNYNQDFGFTITKMSNDLQVNSLHFNTRLLSLPFDLNIGTRINYYQHHNYQIDPRISFNYSITENLQTTLSFEKRSQVLHQINENAAGDISLENFVWVLSDGINLPTITSHQVNLGFLLKKNKYVFDFDIYLKKISGITSFSEGVLFSETEASNTISTLTSGISLVKGFDISFQKEITNLKMWSNYSFLNVENKIEGLNNDMFFKSNGSITHSFNFSTSYKVSRLYFTLGWFWNSGRPYSILDENNSIVKINTKKLANFHSLDFSVLYTIYKNSKYKLKTGVAINNLYNHKVIINREISRVYSSIQDLTLPKYDLKNYYSIGFTPNIFLKFSF